MTSTTMTLAERAEAAIRRLRDIESVGVQVDDDEIREIHVMTHSARKPKNIVRDIQSVLRASLGVSIDYQVVSVAVAERPEPALDEAPIHEVMREVPRTAAHPVAESDVEEPVAPEPATALERIRFEGVNLFVSGPRTQVQVELRWNGSPRIGSASGWSTRDESHRLVAQATATAVQEYLADPVALGVHDVEFVELAGRRVVVVSMTLLAHRQERFLTGSCAVGQDTPQAVVLASLAALNRIVSGMRVKEPTEYVLRPQNT